MSKRANVAVIGCGIFGAEIAVKLRHAGLSVSVFEAQTDILMGASKNNQNRLHLGFHYPRDLETGKQSVRGFRSFVETYPQAIEGGFPNAYFIANEGSLTSSDDYLNFCAQLGVFYERISVSDFPVEIRGANTGILCEEVVYDCNVLRNLVWNRLKEANVTVLVNNAVTGISKLGERYLVELSDQSRVYVDAVINCSYADINRLTGQLGYATSERQFEYTVVPIIRARMPKVGITIMDGPFMTVLPHGKSGNFLLYNVTHTVVAQEVAKHLDQKWLDPSSAPFAGIDRSKFFETMIRTCERYVPDLGGAELVGFLEGPRMVLSRKEDTDARPSLIEEYGTSYFTVFSGKIDHCMWVAEDVGMRLGRLFRKQA